MTAVRALDPAGLEFTAEGHRYTFDGVPVRSVTQILGIITAPIYRRIYPDVLAAAAERGSNVHAWTELYDLDEAESFGPTIRAFDGTILHGEHAEFEYVRAWIRFRTESGFIPEIVEQRFYHPKYHYAGTVDRVGILNGRRATLEIKTVANLAPWVGLQTGGYHEAYNVGLPFAERAKVRLAVQLRRDGTYRLEEYTDNAGDLAAFLACKQIWDWCDANRSEPPSLDLEGVTQW